MKVIAGFLCLVFTMYSCTGNVANQGGLDWSFYKKKSAGTTVKILCSIQDLNEFNFLKTKLKSLLKDSFKINALIYFMNKDRIVKTLLDDSKKNNKVVYDIVIADPDIMQSLFSLGLLYGKYLNTLPNNKDLDYSFINALKPYTELRDYVIPYSCNQYSMIYDSCVFPNGINLTLPDISNICIVKDENYINNLYYIFSKIETKQKTKLSENKEVNPDSITLILKSKALLLKDFMRRLKNKNIDGGVLRNSQALILLSNPNFTDLKIKNLDNDFPVYYKMSGITNTSGNVIASMLVLNELISKSFQIEKYSKTFQEDLPVFNLSAEIKLSKSDTVYNKFEFNKLIRSKLCFSIADNRDAYKWWSSGVNINKK